MSGITLQDPSNSQIQWGNNLQARLIRFGNRIADRLAGADSEEVLNPEPWLGSSDNPAQALLQAANGMKAEAIDPLTGLIDYSSLAKSDAYAYFREVTRSLPNCDPIDLPDRASRIAFWINLYNALILDAIVSYQIQGSILRNFGIFRKAAYNVGGLRFSADDIEHGILRGNRRNPIVQIPPFTHNDPRLTYVIEPTDPRIHFALVCGARSCPPIAFYTGERLDSQLDQAASSFINDGGVHFDPSSGTFGFSQIFKWYQRDFGGRSGVLKLVQTYLDKPEIIQALKQKQIKIRYLPYDWSVNAV